MRTYRFLVISLLAACWLIAAGCTRPALPPIIPGDAEVLDVATLPQDLAAYAQGQTETWVFDRDEHEAFAIDYEARHFAPWSWDRTSYANATEALWGVGWLLKEREKGDAAWGENLRMHSAGWIDDLIRRARPGEFPSMARRAITVAPSHFRVMPTLLPYFGDPSAAGEGFPFDYFQNSVVWPGTPVLVTHATDNGAWLFAEAGYVSGWVLASDLAWVDSEFAGRFRTGLNGVVLADGVEMIDETGTFRFRASLGTILPMVDIDAQSMTVLVPAADSERNALMRRAQLVRGLAAPWPLPPTLRAVTMAGNRMMGQPYGWGGLYENRDCSALLRDLFSAFGVWLPRNSSKQAKAGRFMDVSALTPEQKENLLLEKGVPWRTLVWMRGHIMLYIGVWDGERDGRPLVFHDTWGVKVIKGGLSARKIIGKAVVTTLTPGIEIDGATDLRERIQGFSFLEPGLDMEAQ